MTIDFSINTRQMADITLIRVSGFLDAHTFEELESTISELFADGQYRIIVELSAVDYISSAGAGVFIGALSEARDNGGNIVQPEHYEQKKPGKAEDHIVCFQCQGPPHIELAMEAPAEHRRVHPPGAVPCPEQKMPYEGYVRLNPLSFPSK